MGPKTELLVKAGSVCAAVLSENIARPVARTRCDVPRDASAMSTEWLTAVLCDGYPDARVIAFIATPASSGTSSRSTLRIQYNDAGHAAGLPEHLFVKASRTLAQRFIIGGSGSLAGESRFFMDLLPQTKIEAPKGYWGAYDEASWRSVILMEDVAYSKGARFIEPTTPLTRGQVEDIVGQMGTYHGNFWDSPDLATLRTPRDFLRRLSAFANMRARAAVGLERAKAAVPRVLQDQSERIWKGTVRSLDIATDDLTPTLLHADSHVGQTYVTADGRMGLTDWQTCMRGGWAYDFTYFVITACEPEDRRRWEKDLLHYYLEHLRKAGGDAPTFDEAWNRYRQMVFYPTTAWLFTLGRAAYQPRMQPYDTCLALIRRLFAAIEDLDSLSAL